jgi:hypothetical protein
MSVIYVLMNLAYAIVVNVHAEEHNIHKTYITTYPPSGVHTFNAAWIARYYVTRTYSRLVKVATRYSEGPENATRGG